MGSCLRNPKVQLPLMLANSPSTNPFRKVLAIDYGTARIGVAISYGTIAEPLTILRNDDSVFSQLEKIIFENGVTMLIVGISESKTMERTIEFVAQLRQHISLPVELTDETLSTQEARGQLESQGRSRFHAQTARVDHMAAANFLQEWLDTHPLLMLS